MPNYARRGRAAQVAGALVTVAGLIVFLAAPRVTEVLLGTGPGGVTLDSAVVIWGAGRLAGALLVVAGLLVFAGAVAYLRGLRVSKP